MATHSSIVALRIPCTEEPGELQFHGDCRGSDTTDRLTHIHINLSIIPGTRVCGGVCRKTEEGLVGRSILSGLVFLLSVPNCYLLPPGSVGCIWG